LESIEEDEELEDVEDEECSLEDDEDDDDDDEVRGKGEVQKSSVKSIHPALPFFTSPSSLFKLLRTLISFEVKGSRGFFSFFTSSFTLYFKFRFISGLLPFPADDEDPSNVVSISIT
jgi:hypothetical protein